MTHTGAAVATRIPKLLRGYRGFRIFLARVGYLWMPVATRGRGEAFEHLSLRGKLDPDCALRGICHKVDAFWRAS